jgi:hypothetical protein
MRKYTNRKHKFRHLHELSNPVNKPTIDLIFKKLDNKRLRLRSYFINLWLMFSQGFQTLENNWINSTVHRAIFFIVLSRVCKTLKTIKTAQPNRPRAFIALLVLQTLENKKNRLGNSLVNSIILKCLETPATHSHSFMKYCIVLPESGAWEYFAAYYAMVSCLTITASSIITILMRLIIIFLIKVSCCLINLSSFRFCFEGGGTAGSF